jgi:hypothetical protein
MNKKPRLEKDPKTRGGKAPQYLDYYPNIPRCRFTLSGTEGTGKGRSPPQCVRVTV